MGFFARLLGISSPTENLPPFDFRRNKYRAKRTWPPDFALLSEKQQFRFERKFRRRSALKYARPTFMKVTKLAQWGSILGVTVYMLFYFEDPQRAQQIGKEQPFSQVREWYKGAVDSIWSHSTDTRKVEEAQRRAEDIRRAREGS